ncbi:hypothetical protein RJ641_004081 [Dillenia turbinata]|uniref:Membrane-associated kinase regulator 1 n=1 Tax=Dillenia turbinata TaxID=194707 RepID=A0AAN8Z9S3_9MAGN
MAKKRSGERESSSSSPPKSQTLPSSPSHSFSSSSSSDFEFTVTLSPRKSISNLCPADELFYKGQLLPLHLSPRISMVRTLLLSSSSTSSSSDTTTCDSRDSNGSSNDSFCLLDCDSSRPSSVTDQDDELKRLTNQKTTSSSSCNQTNNKKSKYLTNLLKFSSVFRSRAREDSSENSSGSVKQRLSASAREIIRKYLKKVKPLCERLSQRSGSVSVSHSFVFSKKETSERSIRERENKIELRKDHSQSFSGNLRHPRKRSCVSSCPSSMRSSPSHSGVLNRGVIGRYGGAYYNDNSYASSSSSMEELQSAIQGAIAHCKNSMNQNRSMAVTVSNEV